MSYSDDTTVIARTVARIVVPLILVTAVALLFQGHNLPGGGFIAGVLTAAAFALVYVIFGLDYLQETLFDRDVEASLGIDRPAIVTDFRSMFGIGLLIASMSGLAAIAFGDAFLNQVDDTYYGAGLGVVGDFVFDTLFQIHWATAFAFDLGVYLVVVGGLLTILSVVGGE
ncbi:MnhB domain-containing protein [Haloarchaeobius amylolyticus]|uniref:MnhB domain-containing protein n=1 Tax=Haloarchaeobius amylolyticus TaxID=1198296 RepID=UPI00227029FE|nr:MnhB domain-containing protein [Haloarchaeobius amylolyticus]